MSESSTSQPRDDEPFDAEAFARETIKAIEWGDEEASALEVRVARIEEVIAARWPRSMFLRRRLARELRASARTPIPDMPDADWVTRRTEAAGFAVMAEWHRRTRPAHAADPGQPGDADPGAGFLA